MSYDLIVISSYPRQGTLRDKFTVGVADYTKQTLTSLPSHLKILVLAEKIKGESNLYTEKNITIKRLWTRNSPISLFKIFQEILFYPHTPILHEFEMAMYGNPLMNLFFIKLLFLLKLFNHSVTVVLHQVVLDFNEISGHIGQSKNSPINGILNTFAKVFYKLVIIFSTKVIVFEQFLKTRLNPNNSKIIVIPHGVESNHKPARPAGGSYFINHKSFIITVFGYLAWYKGTDWVVKTFSQYFDKHPQSKFKLIIAGGPNPNHLDKPYYQKYLSEIKNFASKHPIKIILTDFVPETEIGDYYQQSDLILLPYRVGMSSSGPLSLAFAYHKPFLVSTKISPILDTSDIHQLIDRQSVEFDLNSQSLFSKLIKLQKNKTTLSQLSLASEKISQSRSWQNISLLYLQCLNL